MNRDIRKITDGAMMAAIVGVALLINRQTAGLLETMIIWAFPLPMVFYGAKYGWKSSFMLLAAVMVLAFIFGTPQTWFYVASEMLIGMIYGCGIYHKRPARRLVLETIVLSIVCNIVTMLVFAGFFGYDLAAEVTELEQYLTGMMSIMETSGSGSALETMNLSSLIMIILILSTLLNGVLSGYLTHAFSRIMLKRLRFDVEPLQQIVYYYPPKWSGYLGIAGVVLYYYAMGQTTMGDTMRYGLLAVGLGAMMYLMMYGFLALLLICMRAFHSKVLSVIIALGITVVGSVAVAIVGFMYITTDFHQRLLEGVNGNASEA